MTSPLHHGAVCRPPLWHLLKRRCVDILLLYMLACCCSSSPKGLTVGAVGVQEAVLMEVLRKLRSLSRSKSAATIEQTFQRFDKDGSKQLDPYEFKQAMKALRIELDDARVAALMDVFDTNQDGTLNYSEFLFMFVDRRAILRKWEESVGLGDHTGDGLKGGVKGAFSFDLSAMVACWSLCRRVCTADGSYDVVFCHYVEAT